MPESDRSHCRLPEENGEKYESRERIKTGPRGEGGVVAGEGISWTSNIRT